MPTPDSLEWEFTIATAVARFEELRYRSALAAGAAELAREGGPAEEGGPAGEPPLSREEALELLSLGELIARKAGYGRQLDIRWARAAGASWSQIGEALGTSKQSAWEAHTRWIDAQAEQHRRSGYEGLDEEQIAAARALAGGADEAA
jgi:hypothetical protein